MRQKEQYKFGHKSGRARIVLDCRRNARNCTLSVARKGCPWGGEGRDVFIMRQNLLFLLFLVWGRPVWCLGYCNLHQRGLETRGLEIGGGGGMFWRRGWEERWYPCVGWVNFIWDGDERLGLINWFLFEGRIFFFNFSLSFLNNLEVWLDIGYTGRVSGNEFWMVDKCVNVGRERQKVDRIGNYLTNYWEEYLQMKINILLIIRLIWNNSEEEIYLFFLSK